MTQQRRQSLLDGVQRAGKYLTANRAGEALRTLKSLRVRAVEAPDVYYVQASVAICLEQWADALVMLTDLIQLIPDKPNLHLDRVKCLIELGRLDEAQNVLEGEGAPLADNPLRCLFLARIVAEQGELAQTVEWLKQACQFDRTALAEVICQRASTASLRSGDARVPSRYN